MATLSTPLPVFSVCEPKWPLPNCCLLYLFSSTARISLIEEDPVGKSFCVDLWIVPVRMLAKTNARSRPLSVVTVLYLLALLWSWVQNDPTVYELHLTSYEVRCRTSSCRDSVHHAHAFVIGECVMSYPSPGNTMLNPWVATLDTQQTPLHSPALDESNTKRRRPWAPPIMVQHANELLADECSGFYTRCTSFILRIMRGKK